MVHVENMGATFYSSFSFIFTNIHIKQIRRWLLREYKQTQIKVFDPVVRCLVKETNMVRKPNKQFEVHRKRLLLRCDSSREVILSIGFVINV